MATPLKKRALKIIHKAAHQPGLGYLMVVLSIAWFAYDFFSMEATIGVFVAAATLIQHYSEVPMENESRTAEPQTPAVKRAVWVAAKHCDLTKMNQALFDRYRALVNCKTPRDLYLLKKEHSLELAQIDQDNSRLIESYAQFTEAVDEGIKVLTSPQGSIYASDPKGEIQFLRFGPAKPVLNAYMVYGVILGLAILVRFGRMLF